MEILGCLAWAGRIQVTCGERKAELNNTRVPARTGGVWGGLPATPLLPSSSGALRTAQPPSLALAPQGPPLPVPTQGRFPEGLGGGDSLLLFFLQFSFQKKWNNSPGPCSPPSPLLPAFPAAPEPASCPCSSLCSLPSPAACRGGKSQGWGGGSVGEEGARGYIPPILYVSPRVWVVVKDREGALSLPEPGLPPRRPQA